MFVVYTDEGKRFGVCALQMKPVWNKDFTLSSEYDYALNFPNLHYVRIDKDLYWHLYKHEMRGTKHFKLKNPIYHDGHKLKEFYLGYH